MNEKEEDVEVQEVKEEVQAEEQEGGGADVRVSVR